MPGGSLRVADLQLGDPISRASVLWTMCARVRSSVASDLSLPHGRVPKRVDPEVNVPSVRNLYSVQPVSSEAADAEADRVATEMAAPLTPQQTP